VVLTLAVENTASTKQNASFMLNLPMGAWTDCSHSSANSTHTPAATSHIACMKACEAASSCASWQFAKDGCDLNSDVPLTSHLVGGWCGIKSKQGWQVKDGGLTRSTRPLPSGPSMGDMTLRPVLSGGATASFATGDDPAAIYQAFAEHGSFPTGSLVASGDAAHGAVAVTVELEAGAKTTLSLVFAWHFPDRDFSRIILGNMYTELWPDSAAVAEELATESKLTSVLADINSHHHAVASPDNPTPVWLKDQLLNQWSHFHMLMWYKDGRLREYEAWSCDDVDSVHNDYQRHLLYLWAYPEFEINKM
jgi:non-lysosomal glucosylceramidase